MNSYLILLQLIKKRMNILWRLLLSATYVCNIKKRMNFICTFPMYDIAADYCLPFWNGCLALLISHSISITNLSLNWYFLKKYELAFFAIWHMLLLGCIGLLDWWCMLFFWGNWPWKGSCVAVLTDKTRIHLRSASVRTPHLFHHGIPKVLVNPRSKGITSA
jgi:hypothetical protein